MQILKEAKEDSKKDISIVVEEKPEDMTKDSVVIIVASSVIIAKHLLMRRLTVGLMHNQVNYAEENDEESKFFMAHCDTTNIVNCGLWIVDPPTI